MPLVPYDDIRGLLPTQEFADTQLDAAMRLVAGWLRGATGQAELPAELPADHPLYAAAVELVVLTITNPEGVQSRGYGPKTRTYATESRREVILAQVRETYRRSAIAPAGCFPPPQTWPEAWPIR